MEKIDLRDTGAVLSFVEKTLNPYIQKQYDCRKILADEKRDALIACLVSENLSPVPLELIQKIHQIQKILESPPAEAVEQYLAERNEIPKDERIKFTGWLLCGGIRDLEAACIAHGRSEDTRGLLINALSEDYPEAIIKMDDLLKRTKGLSQTEIEKYIDSLSVL